MYKNIIQNLPCLTYFHLVLHILYIQFNFAGWYENPIKSVVLTFPINKILFPTVTLCPRDSRPDRWGSVIKIFDQMETECVSKRWAYWHVQCNGTMISFLTFFNIWENYLLLVNSFLQLSLHPKIFTGYIIINLWPTFLLFFSKKNGNGFVIDTPI